MIADVILKNGWYQSLNESGKKIQEKSANSMGELMGFTEKSENSLGMFKNATGTSVIFVKNGWAVTYDMTFKKISERHV